MLKIAMDATYLEALIYNKHEKHDFAHRMGHEILDNFRICLPIEEYSKIFDSFKYCDEQIQHEIREVILNNVTIFSPDKNNMVDALSYFNHLKDKLSYYDCILLDYCKKHDIHYIISFDEKWDNIERIKRIYSINKTNNRIYFPKWY